MAYTIYRCPHCNKVIDFEPGPAWDKQRIEAPKIIKCTKCGKSISNGNKEWVEMSPHERGEYWRKFWIGTIPSVWAFSLFISILLSLGVDQLFEINGTHYMYIIIFSLPIFGIFFSVYTFKNTKKEINASLLRTGKTQ